MKVSTKAEYRKRRHLRLRKLVRGTAERPRMSVFVSNLHMYVQFINDDDARTLAAASTLQGEKGKNNVAAAQRLGEAAARVARERGITQVVFDRGGFAYRGRVKALAEAARAGGLQF